MINELYSRRGLKRYITLSRHIEAIREGKRAILYGHNYVVLSKNIYDEMVRKLNLSEYQTISIDENVANNWVKEMFLRGTGK